MTPEIILLIIIAASMAYIARLMERLSRAVESMESVSTKIEYLLDDDAIEDIAQKTTAAWVKKMWHGTTIG